MEQVTCDQAACRHFNPLVEPNTPSTLGFRLSEGWVCHLVEQALAESLVSKNV